MKSIFHENHIENKKPKSLDLYVSALEFRLLREHGYNASAEVFNHFKDEIGNVKPYISDDVNGMLSLYEASYFSVEGEYVLDDARDFTSKNLKKYANNSVDYLSKLVSHALEIPLAWRPPKMEASWFIHAYESKHDMEPILVELAKLDFNMVQAMHQQEVKETNRWWKSTRIAEKLSFSRDWVMENYLYAVGMIFEPHYTYSRIIIAKINQLFTTMDDIYDVYGTIAELELLTDAIVRWDINALDQLPDYMKLFFLALYNYVNELAYDILKDQGFHIIPYIKKSFADYAKAYLVEAKWYQSEYTPTLQEYLDNGWISMPVPVILIFSYFCIENPITKEAAECLVAYPDLFRWLSIIMRLAEDLGTFKTEMERGDAPKSIQCYMHETGATEHEARDHIWDLIMQMWKNVNRDRFSNPLLSRTMIGVGMNMIRLTQNIYPHAREYDGVLEKSTAIAMSLLYELIA